MKHLRRLFLPGLLLGCRLILLAQPAAMFDENQPFYTESSGLGISILSSPTIRLGSVSDYRNGVSVDNNTLQLNVSLGLNWSLQVRALGNLVYQTYSIPVSAIGVQAVSLGTKPEIFLTTTNQTLAAGFASSLLNTILVIRYRAVGGNDFLKPAGTYTTTLLFTYSAL